MGNLVATLKRFISNKNTVTILAVLAGIIILWYFYNYRELAPMIADYVKECLMP